jgi:hypothetical protein
MYNINMDLTDINKPFFGVTNGVYYGQHESENAINHGIYSRVVPDAILKPNFDKRPVPTRYNLFPALQGSFNQGSFNKDGIHMTQEDNKINTESMLRNQYFANQRGADQSVYVPSSDSDLYKVHVNGKTQQTECPFKMVGKTDIFDKNHRFHPETNPIGKDVFFNNTRTQLRNS